MAHVLWKQFRCDSVRTQPTTFGFVGGMGQWAKECGQLMEVGKCKETFPPLKPPEVT